MEPEVVQRPPWYVEPNEGESISHYRHKLRLVSECPFCKERYKVENNFDY